MAKVHFSKLGLQEAPACADKQGYVRFSLKQACAVHAALFAGVRVPECGAGSLLVGARCAVGFGPQVHEATNEGEEK
jgi:hypothetical protein